MVLTVGWTHKRAHVHRNDAYIMNAHEEDLQKRAQKYTLQIRWRLIYLYSRRFRAHFVHYFSYCISMFIVLYISFLKASSILPSTFTQLFIPYGIFHPLHLTTVREARPFFGLHPIHAYATLCIFNFGFPNMSRPCVFELDITTTNSISMF